MVRGDDFVFFARLFSEKLLFPQLPLLVNIDDHSVQNDPFFTKNGHLRPVRRGVDRLLPVETGIRPVIER